MADLTLKEKQWLQRVQKALDSCPSNRLGFYTSGDPTISIFDATRETEINEIMDCTGRDFGPTATELDAQLGQLTFPNAVLSTAA